MAWVGKKSQLYSYDLKKEQLLKVNQKTGDFVRLDNSTLLILGCGLGHCGLVRSTNTYGQI